MKAVVKTKPEFGAVEALDMPMPKIEPNEVLVQIKACGICGSDLGLYEWREADRFRFGIPIEPPVIIGHEPAGVVAEVGAEVPESWGSCDAVVLTSLVHHPHRNTSARFYAVSGEVSWANGDPVDGSLPAKRVFDAIRAIAIAAGGALKQFLVGVDDALAEQPMGPIEVGRTCPATSRASRRFASAIRYGRNDSTSRRSSSNLTLKALSSPVDTFTASVAVC